MTQMCVRLVREEDGQDLIEYGLLAALIAIVAVLAVQAVGTALVPSYQNIATQVP